MARAVGTPGSKTEAWLAVNPADPSNVVVSSKDNNPESSSRCTWNGIGVTHDGGRTWTNLTIGGKHADRQPGAPWYGYSCNTDPMFTFDAAGDLHYVMELYNLAGPDGSGPLGPDPVAGRALLLAGWKLLLVTSHDGGLTWPDVVTLLEADGVTAINDYSRITVNEKTGTVLTMINTFNGGPFVGASAAYNRCSVIAERNGATSLYQSLPDNDAPTCMEIIASPAGKIVLLYSDGFGSSGTARAATSEDDGSTFTDPVEVFTYDAIPSTFEGSRYRTGSNFEAEYDATAGPQAGRLYVAYAQQGAAGDADVMVRWSDDDGATWSEPVRARDEAGGRHQFLANVAVAGDGSVHLFFLERGTGAADALLHAWHAVSGDGGSTWQSREVSHVGWDGDKGVHQEGFPFIGDYVGTDAAGEVVWGAFPDASGTNVPTLVAAKVTKA